MEKFTNDPKMVKYYKPLIIIIPYTAPIEQISYG